MLKKKHLKVETYETHDFLKFSRTQSIICLKKKEIKK